MYQRCLANLWLDLGRQQFYLAYEHIAKKSFQEGLSLMKEVSRSVEEAALYNGDKDHDSEVRVLRLDYQANICIAESLQVIIRIRTNYMFVCHGMQLYGR